MKNKAIEYIVIFILALLLAFVYMELQESKASDQRKDSVIAEKNDSIRYHKNELGKVVASKTAAVIKDGEDLKTQYPGIYADLQEQFGLSAKEIKKDLRAYIHSEFEARGSGTGTVINHYHNDSSANNILDSAVIKTGDDYMSHQVTYIPGVLNPPYSYVYRDTARTVFLSDKRFWQFWKDEHLTARTTFSNPNSKSTKMTNIMVNSVRDKRFSVSISGGWGLVKVGNEVHTGFFVGPSFSYYLIKF